MLSITEQNDLAEEVLALSRRRDWPGILDRLQHLPEEELLNEPLLGYRLGLAHAALGHHDEARRLHTLLMDRCSKDTASYVYRGLFVLSSNVYIGQGNLSGALDAARRALALGSEANDLVVQAAAVMNIGIVATIRCEWDEAIAAYGRAQAAYQQIGRRASVAGCHQNLGMTYRQIGAYGEAQTHFEHALSHRGHLSELWTSVIEMERALLISAMGDAPLAETLARRQLEVVRRVGSKRSEGEGLRILGIVLSGHKREEARDCFRRSLEIARDTGTRLLQAEVHEELAVLAAQEGDRDAAASEAAESARLFWLIGAEAHARRVWRRLGESAP